MQTLATRFDPRANNFDLIRLVSALIVVFAHSYALARKEYDPLSTLLDYGFSGTLAVWSFLVISGFLVARSLENTNLTAFVWARFLRIYPAFAVVILLESLIIAPFFYEADISDYWRYWFAYHLHNLLLWPQDPYLPNVFSKLPYGAINGSLWTIPLEISFYIVLVLIAAVETNRTKFFYPVAFALSIIAYFVMSYDGIDATVGPKNVINGISLFQIFNYISYFLAGVCAWKYRTKISISFGGFTVALVAMLACRDSLLGPLVIKFALPYIVLYLSVCGSVGTIIASRIGDPSYGIYLLAYPITNSVVAVTNARFDGLKVFLLSLPIILVAGALSWRLVEKPALSLKRPRN